MDYLRRQYFAMVPVKSIQWQGVVQDWKSFSTDLQEELLLSTILHWKSLMHPLPASYNRTFIKHIMSECESVGSEVLDELYEIYTNLVALPDASDGEYCCKTYFLNETFGISLIESRSFISQGTTGLQTWQAAKFLSEWVIQHKHLFKAKNVLELGSGLGLLGLITCYLCDPLTFNYTDCHESVLKSLAHNIEINSKIIPMEMKSTHDLRTNMQQFQDALNEAMARNKDLVNTLGETDLNKDSWSSVPAALQKWRSTHDPRMFLTKLDWEEASEEALSEAFADVDVILASDVVFDTRIIPALVKVMCVLAKQSNAMIYVASTVRNPATRDQFLRAIGEAHLKYEFISDVPDPVFFYDKSVAIELVKISS